MKFLEEGLHIPLRQTCVEEGMPAVVFDKASTVMIGRRVSSLEQLYRPGLLVCAMSIVVDA